MSDRTKLRLLVTLAIPLVFAAPSQRATAADEVQPGKALYLKYCSACHGADAKGDGVAGSLMQPKPADLTRLSARYGGEFPMEQVVRTIDGRQALHAHGEPTMPVWGEVLSDQHGSGDERRPAIERRVQGRIFLIADYLRTIQAQ
jgi:mono/diheme cytochrome c family protein